jgi:hypothetical protein
LEEVINIAPDFFGNGTPDFPEAMAGEIPRAVCPMLVESSS